MWIRRNSRQNYKIKYSIYYFPLTCICNKSLSTGLFPERPKYALIRPVHKKGDKCLITSYRPISLLTSFSKIFEKLIFTRLYKHLLANQILAKEQYGFRNNSYTENAAYDVVNEIIQAMNHKRSIGGLFCELEKAFDCVNHEIKKKKTRLLWDKRKIFRPDTILPPRKISKSIYKQKFFLR